LSLQSSTIDNNQAFGAGAISATDSSSVNLVNSTISSNSASFVTGGIGLSNSTLVLVNSTVTGNSAPNYASGLYRGGASSRIEVFNSIVAQNPGSDDCNTPVDLFLTANLFGDASCDGSADAPVMLAPLANNGGPTQTHALLPNSPAINLGSPLICAQATNNKDQRGFDRVEQCDIGAFEFGASDTVFFTIPLANGNAVVIPL